MTRRQPPKRRMIPPKHRPDRTITPPAEATPPAPQADPDVLRPVDVPRVRREVHEFLASQGTQHYYQAALMGRQQILPPGPLPQAAERLAVSERKRITEADLWYVDADLCDLLAAAYPTMPGFAPVESDLPSRRGFVVFARPIDSQAQGNLGELLDIMFPRAGRGPEVTALVDRIVATPTRIVAASWGPIEDVAPRPGWPAGGCWVTFYGGSFIHRERASHPLLEKAAKQLPPMTPDNECGFAWYPDGGDQDRYLLPDDAGATSRWARLLLGAFRLAAQANLVDTRTVERAPRGERRRGERDGLPARDVRVIRLRPALREARDAAAPAGAGREYRVRWIVRGHWRQQAYGRGRELRRPVWVAPFVKGPEGAPLLGGERVNVIG